MMIDADDPNPGMNARPAAFLDRDGILNVDIGYLSDPADLRLTPTAIDAVRLLNRANYLVIVVTNQSGVARGLYTTRKVDAVHAHMASLFAAADAHIDAFYYCPFHPDGSVAPFNRDHEDRKPAPGMLQQAMRDWSIDRQNSFLVGDKPSDIEAARRAGIAGILVERDVRDLATVIDAALAKRAGDPPDYTRQEGTVGFQRWIVTEALPFWADRGHDPTSGTFYERLDLAGRPIDVPCRAMVQARQIYVFAHAAERGWFMDGGRLAERSLVSLIHLYGDRSHGELSFAFTATTGGTLVSPVRDAYTHAFVLLALAWVYRLNGDRLLLTLASEVAAFIDRALTDPCHGGLFSQTPAEDRVKRQNPLMHLLEAYLFLAEAAPGHGYEERAAALVALFEQRMFDPVHGVLVETYAGDWSADIGNPLVEPGHLFEWAWLLDWFARTSGNRTHAARLRQRAQRIGFAPSGLIWDAVDPAGAVLRRSHRLWPHCEALKALAIVDQASSPTERSTLNGICTKMFDQFLRRPFNAGWIDRVDEHGRVVSEDVPASSLYHLVLAAAELERASATTPLVAAAR